MYFIIPYTLTFLLIKFTLPMKICALLFYIMSLALGARLSIDIHINVCLYMLTACIHIYDVVHVHK